MIADLHIHTNASDGIFSPQEILFQAQKAKLKYISVTDHDTVEGVRRLSELTDKDITIIPGVELNTDLPDTEVHILGYGINLNNITLNSELSKITEDRTIRARKMTDKLCTLGFPVDFSRVLEIAGNAKSLGRPHLAKALLEKGYFTSFDEIFKTLLDKNGPAYIPHYKLSPEEAINLVKVAGGTPVLAHPGLIGSEKIVFQLIKQGIHGIEVYHPKHTDEQTDYYLSMAQKFNLLVTGGSDYHGIAGRFPEKLGHFTVSATLAEDLIRRSGIIR